MTRQRQWLFVVAVIMVTVGVLLHLPDVKMLIERDGMSGMSMWTPMMASGMFLLLAGVALATIALFPRRPPAAAKKVVSLDAIEHGKLRPIYWVTCGTLVIALVVDTMKPLTLGFVMPGMADEYGKSLAEISVFPFVALVGTAIGSVIWGLLGDRYGRRPALLLATVLFLATSACGAMPRFEWNLVMCFVMGVSAGGMLPLVFTLVAELAPRRHRAWMAVTVGGIGGLGGYLAASLVAYYLEPSFTWRSLWLIGLPTGVMLLALTPLIPESPLFLLRLGRRAEAEEILRRYGSRLGEVPETTDSGPRPGVKVLLQRYPALTAVIGMVGITWGLVNFGFLVMLPSHLRDSGLPAEVASGLLARSALFSTPALLLVVALYAWWSGHRSLILFVTIMGLALGGMGLWSLWGSGRLVLVVSIGTLVLGLSAVNAMLLPYSAEIYPTVLRGTGSGFAAAATKCGGVLGPIAMVLAVKWSPDLHISALLLSAVALSGLSLLAALLMLRYGNETRRAVPAHSQAGP